MLLISEARRKQQSNSSLPPLRATGFGLIPFRLEEGLARPGSAPPARRHKKEGRDAGWQLSPAGAARGLRRTARTRSCSRG